MKFKLEDLTLIITTKEMEIINLKNYIAELEEEINKLKGVDEDVESK